MKKLWIILAVILSSSAVQAQDIYHSAFGNPFDPAIIFLHGGPGYNCVGFEATTARTLAENGFFVICYDRRGEGRSAELNAAFTFEESFEDILKLYDEYDLKKATLIGHSFGGVLATLFAEKYPKKTESIVLVGSPLAMQETFSTIIKSCKKIYYDNLDQTNLGYIEYLEKMNKKSLEYSSYCFSHAMQNGFYSTLNPTEEAKEIYKELQADSAAVELLSSMSYEGPQGFWKNEKYTTLDVSDNLKKVIESKVQVLGMYGMEDGLFSKEQIEKIEGIIGKENFMYLENCSHNVFMDRRVEFIGALRKWIK